MSSSNSSSKKPVAKPQVKVPAAAVPKESAKAAQPKKPAAVVPAPKPIEKAAPAKAVPVKAAPAEAVPVKAVPVKAVPVKEAPADAVPVKATPIKAAPLKAALVKAAPVKAAPKSPVETKPKAAAKPAAPAPKAKKETPELKAAAKTPEVSKRRIDTPEIQEKIRELIKLAKEQDYLTYDDINEILPNDLVDPDDVEAIMERLRNMEFDIIDASEVDRYKDKKRDEGEGDEEDVKADQKLDILDDPVRMYLKQMGQVPLLTREQEVEISKRIEDAEIEVARHLHLFGFVTDSYLELADKLNKGKEGNARTKSGGQSS